jgi:hypothetical protein
VLALIQELAEGHKAQLRRRFGIETIGLHRCSDGSMDQLFQRASEFRLRDGGGRWRSEASADDLAPFRGIALGVGISALIWIVGAVIVLVA